MKVLVENSTWNNIGDGFYQFSILGLFQKNFPDWDVKMMDGPIQRAFRPSNRFSKNSFDIMPFYKADLYVLSGPILGWKFVEEYGPFIKKIKEEGADYLILSTHTREEFRSEIAEFFRKYPPIGLASRDSYTYNLFNNYVENCYDGVCTAFLVSKTCSVPDVDVSNKVLLSIYRGYEPKAISLKMDGDRLIDSSVSVSPVVKARWHKILRHFEWMRYFPREISGYEVIRPVQDIGYKYSHLNFARPNSYLSYNPLSYLSLYKNTMLTISDRVHSVVPTLSYGNPAVFVGTTKRSKLFDRMGLEYSNREVLRLDPSLLDVEYDSLVAWIKEVVKG